MKYEVQEAVSDELRDRIAKALGGEDRGWTAEATKSFSIPTLREMLRTVDSKLYAQLMDITDRDAHMFERVKPKRRRF